ncbi:unnamed protein product [Calypogeia fissa]
MPSDDEWDVPEATTFAYWRDVADRVADPEDPMMFEGSGLTRWSILTTLPYWGELKIRHLFDPMHIKGNVGKALIKALYGEKESNFREASEDLEMHPNVWVTIDPIQGMRYDNYLHGCSILARGKSSKPHRGDAISYRLWCQPSSSFWEGGQSQVAKISQDT